MKNNLQALNILLWIAKIGSAFCIAFLLFMIGGHLFGSEDTLPNGFISSSELVTFLFFPIGTLIGLMLAWKRNMLGGLITVLGIICFHFVTGDYYLIPWIDGMTIPGILFLIYGFLKRN